METTPVYKLKKPAATDYVNVEDHSDNFAIIEDALVAHDNALAEKYGPDNKPTAADVGAHAITTRGTGIPDGSDLDTYLTPGDYCVTSSGNAVTITNGPIVNSGYKLIVEQGNGGSGHIYQFAVASGPVVYYRQRTGGVWNEWRQVITNVGGTMSGNMEIKNTGPKLILTDTSDSSDVRLLSLESAFVAQVNANADGSAEWRQLRVKNSSGAADVSNALTLVEHKDNLTTSYKIYGTHNKPTAADIGADESGAAAMVQTALNDHTSNAKNPHMVTAEQVGLGNVPNVATNDQTPTYTAASTLANLTSGEKLSAAFGKIAKAVTDLISHLANKINPHGVTAAQAGARPDTWMPTADDVGARPDTWMPTADDVGAYNLGQGTAIPSGANLDEYFDYGTYYSLTSAISATITNAPVTGSGFRLTVEHGYGAQHRIQRVYADTTGAEYIRVYANSAWGAWRSVFTSNGGTMAGNLEISKATPRLALTNTSTNSNVRLVDMGNRGVFQVMDADSAYRQLRLKTVTNEADLASALDLLCSTAGASKAYKIFGEHNKPTGSYTGTGEARTINTGGVGNVLLIVRLNTSEDTIVDLKIAIVTPVGSVEFSWDELAGNYTHQYIPKNVAYSNGILTTSGGSVNNPGYTYHYYCL